MNTQDNQEALKSIPANGIGHNPGNLVMLARRRCVECSRVFNLLNDMDNQEWQYGHDCEAI